MWGVKLAMHNGCSTWAVCLRHVKGMRALLLMFLATTALAAESGEKHLLYLSSPDGSQPGGFGSGIMVFDIDDGHRFVKRIEVPSFKDGGMRGFCEDYLGELDLHLLIRPQELSLSNWIDLLKIINRK